MKVQLILAMATVVLSAMADTKRSFNVTQTLAKPQPQPVRKPAYRTSPEDRRKLSVFPKNMLKFVATTKAPPKKIDNELRRKHSVLLPKMSKHVPATPLNTSTERPFKSTTMYNFKPTRAPKMERFSNKPRYATTVSSVPLKAYAYKKDLYRRNDKGESLSTKMKATLPRMNEYSEEASHEDDPTMAVRKDLSVLEDDKNTYDDKEDNDVSQEETEDNLSDEEAAFSQEVDGDEPIESRQNDQSIEIEGEPTMLNARVVSNIGDRLKRITEVTTEKTVSKIPNILEQGNALKEEEKEIRTNEEDEVEEKTFKAEGIEDQFMSVRDKINNLGQAEVSDDVEVNTEPLDVESYNIDKRSVIEEENIAPTTVAGIKYTGKELTLSDNSNFRNINA